VIPRKTSSDTSRFVSEGIVDVGIGGRILAELWPQKGTKKNTKLGIRFCVLLFAFLWPYSSRISRRPIFH
jgi:hypothetical protein